MFPALNEIFPLTLHPGLKIDMLKGGLELGLNSIVQSIIPTRIVMRARTSSCFTGILVIRALRSCILSDLYSFFSVETPKPGIEASTAKAIPFDL